MSRSLYASIALTAAIVLFSGCSTFDGLIGEQRYLVQEGQPTAEIIIAQDPPRTVRLAAWELQNHLREISGATLPIVHEPSESTVHIYIGQSTHTDRLGITNDDLKHGAYRIVSGDNWLVLIGTDTDFQPVEPYTEWRSQQDDKLAEWDKIVPSPWGHPEGNSFKHFIKNLDAQYRTPELEESFDIWAHDERGSYNAVCGFLRHLGVRWYMPGELGTVLPQLTSIPLPDLDERVEPAFEIRDSNLRMGIHDRRLAIWGMRLGMRQPHGVVWAHGLKGITYRPELQKQHPEYFLLSPAGDRMTGAKGGKQCLSSPGLFRETVAYARTLADYYNYSIVSVQPSDGYTSFCRCQLCAGKDDPDRHRRGSMSNYVWGFAERVANEVAKTHPDLLIQNMAYNLAMLPPTNIETFPDNLLVCLIGARRPTETDPQERQRIRQWRQEWATLTNRKLANFENYPHTARGHWLPSFTAHTNAASINAIKGDYIGESIEPDSHRFMESVAFNSYQFYFTFRMYWGDENQDIEPMLEEYYTLFYGPARDQMKAFFEYCEANYPKMRTEKAPIDYALALFAEARAQVEPGSVYDQRLALLGEFLEGTAARGQQIARERERQHSPSIRMAKSARGIVIDGQLDDAVWRDIPYYANGNLRETHTGRTPAFPTRFKLAWGVTHIYFAIHCEEPAPKTIRIGSTEDDDPAIAEGDSLHLFLETEHNSYYQITISPSGAVLDLNREGGEPVYRWDSQAEVATHIGDDAWTVELRIPVTEDANDPFHQVIGRRPIESLSWYMNLGRKRPRANGTELSAFSPTAAGTLLVPERFAKLY